jgi:hypothetical protein
MDGRKWDILTGRKRMGPAEGSGLTWKDLEIQERGVRVALRTESNRLTERYGKRNRITVDNPGEEGEETKNLQISGRE